MKKIITGDVDISGVKRCYINVNIEANCPICNKICSYDENGNYLSCPEIGSKIDLNILCVDCDEWFPIAVMIKKATIEFEIVEENKWQA